mgnify:FL=1
MLLDQPYLGGICEFQEKNPGDCPILTRISLLSAAATLSIGPMFGGLNGLKFVLERLVDEICRAAMVENMDIFHDTFENGLRAQKPPGALGSTD